MGEGQLMEINHELDSGEIIGESFQVKEEPVRNPSMSPTVLQVGKVVLACGALMEVCVRADNVPAHPGFR